MYQVDLRQCFPTFFGSRHPYLFLKRFGGTLNWLNRYKGQEILTIRGTPGTSSRAFWLGTNDLRLLANVSTLRRKRKNQFLMNLFTKKLPPYFIPV